MKNTLSILLLLVLLAACGSGYGDKLKFGKGELFYTDKVTQDEAKRLGKFLDDSHMFPDDRQVSYQIDKAGESYVFKIVIADEKYNYDSKFTADVQIITGFMSKDVFKNKPVEYWLCNDKFEPVKKIPFKALPEHIIKQSEEEEKNGGMPKDNVSPVDTSRGTPA